MATYQKVNRVRNMKRKKPSSDTNRLGIVMLAGITTSDSILIVEFARQGMPEGLVLAASLAR